VLQSPGGRSTALDSLIDNAGLKALLISGSEASKVAVDCQLEAALLPQRFQHKIHLSSDCGSGDICGIGESMGGLSRRRSRGKAEAPSAVMDLGAARAPLLRRG
jgi:hypothetical protein